MTVTSPVAAGYGQIRLHDVAGGLFPHDAAHRLVVVFRVYLDESKRDGVFAVGGYLGHEDQWERFEDQWSLALRQAGVQTFHATDFYNRRGEFKGWSDEKQKKFSKLFTAIAESRTEVGIGRAVDEPAYMEILAPVLSDIHWTPHGKFTPLMWCARLCLEGLIVNYRRQIPWGKVPIAVIFEQGDGVGEVIDYLRELQKRGAEWAGYYTSFGDGPKTLLPLQAADLIVYESAKEIDERLNPTGRPMRKSMGRLARTERLDVKVWTRIDLINAVPEVKKRIQPYERKKQTRKKHRPERRGLLLVFSSLRFGLWQFGLRHVYNALRKFLETLKRCRLIFRRRHL